MGRCHGSSLLAYNWPSTAFRVAHAVGPGSIARSRMSSEIYSIDKLHQLVVRMLEL